MDAFDRFWRWANKDPEDRATIPTELQQAVTSLPEAHRHDRNKVNGAYRDLLIDEIRKWPPGDIERLSDELHSLAKVWNT